MPYPPGYRWGQPLPTDEADQPRRPGSRSLAKRQRKSGIAPGTAVRIILEGAWLHGMTAVFLRNSKGKPVVRLLEGRAGSDNRALYRKGEVCHLSHLYRIEAI
jgi:hypothetical protein